MTVAFLIGRIIIGGFFLFSGLNHFMKMEMMSGYAGAKGVPAPKLAVPATGLLLVLGGASLLLGVYTTVGIVLLIVFLIPTSFMMHDFWAAPDDQKTNEMNNFMKNMAIAGALLMFLIIPQPWPYSLGW